MIRTFVALTVLSVSILGTAGDAFAQQNGSSQPVIKVQPAPWRPTPQLPPSIFPAPPSFRGAGSDFFPAAPTDLYNNTNYAEDPTEFTYAVSNIMADDVNISDSLDSDGDNTYYITEIEFFFYVPETALQPIQAEFYIGTDPENLVQIASFELEIPSGRWLHAHIFPRCQPYEIQTTDVYDPDGNLYDRFWIGVRFPQYCAPVYDGGGPGWVFADGPDFQEDVLYWQGDANCGGEFEPGYYFLGGTPRASLYIRVTGAATRDETVVVTADIDDNGCVDDADLLAVLFAFGITGSYLAEDTNCDEVVDESDLLNVLSSFATGC